jgi:thiol:disulfide interchange protein
MADETPKPVVNSFISHFNNQSNIKKLLFFVIVLLIITVLILVVAATVQKYTNVTNHSNKKIEKLSNNNLENKTEAADTQTINLSSKKVNATLFFAEWCGHCKQFKKQSWGKLIETYANSPDVVLHELDCTNIKTEINTPAGKPIQGFPTLVINYVDEDGESIEEEYSGGRTFDAITKHLNKISKRLNK